MEKIYREEKTKDKNQELNDDYLLNNRNDQLFGINRSKKLTNTSKGVNKMAKQLTNTTEIPNRSEYFSSETSYKGVNKMAKQIALESERTSETESVFLEARNTESVQIQRLTVDMPSDLHKEFKLWCVMHNLKMNELIRDLIRETIKA